ncbi:DNA-directed RNA polymerase III subunit RPC6-like [Orbicella faveolata]|uniref:DNA-directed RNA polymerase III subunit RPC6-like n=1 Tax=Orbicella faveolata TaxID=48498 RepID=UPI0009E5C67F|nr:DNA-directed RNA polymerase III subunit RPC6-like [Orbicella faveolata]
MAVADVVIKQEAVDAVDLEERVVELCKANPKGITDQLISQDMPNIPPQQRVTAINRLLSMGRIELLKSGTQLLYRYKDAQAATKTKGFDLQEKLVYQIIEEAQNKGIWIRDIRFKSNIQMTQVNKIVKNLESKKLIKAVKSVAASRKKVYMLFNLEPDITVTGGAWYSDQDFESEFVEVLNQQCYKYLEQKADQADRMNVDPLAKRNASYSSCNDVWKYISELGISKVQLSEGDIETILNTLVFDGKAEMSLVVDSSSGSSSNGQRKLFRVLRPLLPVTGLMRTPCGVCPVSDQCRDGGPISPSKCIYMKDWLAEL